MNINNEDIEKIVGIENIYYNIPMKELTTFKIGGKADVIVNPKTPSQIQALVMYAKKNNIPYTILGNGSNILVSDNGIEGLVIRIADNYGEIKVNKDTIVADSGALLSKVANAAYKNNLTGLEFASGIPGTIGGAMVMNAGAYGGEMKDVVEKVTVLDKDGAIFELSNADMDFSYRTSAVKKHGLVVLQVVMKLKQGESENIKALMDDYKERRVTKQPLSYPSAGSTFKRPEGHFAGKLIEDCGLKGYTVGGAQVSEKHGGFVINIGNATCKDVLTLINDVKQVVKEKTGVELEPEVLLIGKTM